MEAKVLFNPYKRGKSPSICSSKEVKDSNPLLTNNTASLRLRSSSRGHQINPEIVIDSDIVPEQDDQLRSSKIELTSKNRLFTSLSGSKKFESIFKFKAPSFDFRSSANRSIGLQTQENIRKEPELNSGLKMKEDLNNLASKKVTTSFGGFLRTTHRRSQSGQVSTATEAHNQASKELSSIDSRTLKTVITESTVDRLGQIKSNFISKQATICLKTRENTLKRR